MLGPGFDINVSRRNKLNSLQKTVLLGLLKFIL